MTPLMMFSFGGCVNGVNQLKTKYIRKCGKETNREGYTALMYAVEGNHTECARELLDEAGMQNETGDTALLIAINIKNRKLIELLSQYEKDIKDKNNMLPLERACSSFYN